MFEVNEIVKSNLVKARTCGKRLLCSLLHGNNERGVREIQGSSRIVTCATFITEIAYVTALFIFIRNRCARDLPPVTPEATMSRIRALVICSRISALFVRKLLVITRSTLDLHLGNCRRAKWFHLHISGHINDNMWFYEPLNTKLKEIMLGTPRGEDKGY